MRFSISFIFDKEETFDDLSNQDVFGHSIVELAEKNEKIMGITPAMPSR